MRKLSRSGTGGSFPLSRPFANSSELNQQNQELRTGHEFDIDELALLVASFWNRRRLASTAIADLMITSSAADRADDPTMPPAFGTRFVNLKVGHLSGPILTVAAIINRASAY
jgi:hypothetical protein